MDDLQEVKSNWAKFNVVGDYVIGYLLETIIPTVANKYGKKPKTYVFKALEGKFHGADAKTKIVNKEATDLVAGDTWYVSVAERYEAKMNVLKVGQKFSVTFEKTMPSPKGQDAKLLVIKSGGIDPEIAAMQEVVKAY